MIRTLAYQVTLAGICPYAQKAGVQNENQATLINFVLAPELIKTKYMYRVEFVSKQGAFDTTGIIPLIDDTISIIVVNGWTQTAGNHTLRVCISDEDGMDAYSYDCLMILEPRNTGTTNTPEEITTGLTELIAETTEAAQFANEQAERAALSVLGGGYVGMEIKSDGKLYCTRTRNLESTLNFALSNGRLEVQING
jgi:hypothetical protein